MDKSRLHGLYAITDERLMNEQNFLLKAEQALLGGARLIQYRDKSSNHTKRLEQASALKQCCEKYNALLIINDDVELAKNVAADGVHLGKEDGAVAEARRHLGNDMLIGASCYNQLDLALQAEKAGADYVAFGAFFSSPTKPQAGIASLELLKKARQHIQVPICTIGGISTENAHTLVEHGADMTAVISDLFASDDIQASASHIAALFS